MYNFFVGRSKWLALIVLSVGAVRLFIHLAGSLYKIFKQLVREL